MRCSPLLVSWHDECAPLYSVHFQPHGHRLATAGGDTNVRLWHVEIENEKPTYLSTLARHSQAVNCVRWNPKGDVLASAGDDGNVLLWVKRNDEEESKDEDEKEQWQVRRMCRSPSEREIYDLAWSPDGAFFIVGSMDNVARIFDAEKGTIVRQIAEHNHYVQGVAWDPLNEFLATQSSDRSLHLWQLKTNDGAFSLNAHGRTSKMDLPARRGRTSNSPAPGEASGRNRVISDASNRPQSPAPPSMPGTPASLPVPMPPPISHSRRSSISNTSTSIRRSASPAPPMPLPAVMPAASPKPSGVRNAPIYANEQLTSFFRRLTFSPDGSLLFTPAGQFKTSNPSPADGAKPLEEVINTCYIYGRGGLNRPPIAHLPGHRKPSVAVRCSPVFYALRLPVQTKHITVDTSLPAADDTMAPLPEPAHPHQAAGIQASVEVKSREDQTQDSPAKDLPEGPPSAFALPYRMIYAVATQDAIYVYDTQQQTPICVVSNLHYATFTDLTWSNDGLILLMSSSDGFASRLTFEVDELGKKYQGSLNTRVAQPAALTLGGSPAVSNTPGQTPTAPDAPSNAMPRPASTFFAPSPSPITSGRPASPQRSNSQTSIATESSMAHGHSEVKNNPIPIYGRLPDVAVAQPSSISGAPLTSPTPPMTPLATGTGDASTAGGSFAVPAGKREASGDPSDTKEPKRRRVAPTLVQSSKDPSSNG